MRFSRQFFGPGATFAPTPYNNSPNRNFAMHRYRSHTCAQLRKSDVGSDRSPVRLGASRARPWRPAVHRPARPLRPDPDRRRSRIRPAFKIAETVRGEWVIRVDGEVKARMAEAVNANLPTGEIEIFAREIEVLSAAKELPLPVFGEPDYPEDIRLKYRFLDLRRETLHKNIVTRTKIIAEMRRRMGEVGFTEYSTPILTASSPEGARDFLVPSRIHPGQVLRAAAGAAAVQAAADGGRLRPLFPDRAVLPRRGPARRPPAGRVLPARPRDELRRPRKTSGTRWSR